MATSRADETSFKTRLTTSIKETDNGEKSLSLRHQLLPWLPDVASLLLSITFILAVVGLLRRYDGQAVPEWHGVTLNTVIGYLAQGAQVFLGVAIGNAMNQLKWSWFWREAKPRKVRDFTQYEDASRGPLGSLLILRHALQRPLTSLGAMSTIAALALHPFLQTIPVVYARLVPSPDIAALTRQIEFAALEPSYGGVESEEQVDTLRSEVKGAVYAALFNLTSSSTVTASCLSANCTWPTYTSLGICSACSVVQMNSTVDESDYNGPGYIWSLPNGFEINYNSVTMFVSSSMPSTTYPNLADYSIVNLTSAFWVDATDTLDPDPPSSFECTLYFCTQTYSTTMSDGNLLSNIISTFPNASTTVEDATAAIQWPPGSNSSNVNDIWEFTDPSWVTIKAPFDGHEYSFDNNTAALMRQWFNITLQGSINAESLSSTGTSDISQVLYTSQVGEGGPGALMDRIASTVTAYMLNSPGVTVNGTTLVTQQYLVARWGWLALPVVVMVAALVLLVATIWHSLARQVPTWRSSALPTLVYTLDKLTSESIAADGPVLSKLEQTADHYAMAMSQDGVWSLEGSKVYPSVSPRRRARRPRFMKLGRKSRGGGRAEEI